MVPLTKFVEYGVILTLLNCPRFLLLLKYIEIHICVETRPKCNDRNNFVGKVYFEEFKLLVCPLGNFESFCLFGSRDFLPSQLCK